TGTISGTPTAITATASYTVTAANSGGSTRFSLSIAVNDVAPSVSYGSAKLALAMGGPDQTLTPSNSGGNVVTWSIDQSLPQGLVFNNTDGSICGTPSAIAAPAVYVITAENS